MAADKAIDLNCDMGESFGPYRMGQDEAVLPWITSANIACGFHAGDAATMRRTVKLCLEHNVAVGAHPGLPDLQGFGRRTLALAPDEAAELVLYQIGALQAFVRAEGGALHHVKPHGALYHMAERDRRMAEAICAALAKLDPELIVYGQSGGSLVAAAEQAGLRTMAEVFADRGYRADGTLVPRAEKGALLDSAVAAAEQAYSLAASGYVQTVDGPPLQLRAETVCIHGDGAQAAELARAICERLRSGGIVLRAPVR